MNALVVDAKDEQHPTVGRVLEAAGYVPSFHQGLVDASLVRSLAPDVIVVAGPALQTLPGLRAAVHGLQTSILALGEVDAFDALLGAGADDVVTLPLDAVVLDNRLSAARAARRRRSSDGVAPPDDLQGVLEQLQAAEEISRRVLEAVPGGVVHVGVDGRIQAANGAALRLLGLSWDAATRKYTVDFEPVTLREDGTPLPTAEYPVTRALATGEPAGPTTIGVRRPDGEVSWAVFSSVPVRGPGGGGEVTSAVVTFLDVTDRMAAERSLAASEARYRSLVERSPDPILIVQQRRVEFVNSAGIALLGVDSPHVLLGRSLVELVPSQRRDAIEALLRRVLKGDGHALVEEELRRPDGEIVDVEIAAVSLQFQGEPAVQLAVRDITERKRNEERVQRLQRRVRQAAKLESLGALAGGIAHDFNNLLSAVLGNASLARMDAGAGTETAQCLERIETAARRASDLTNQMLAYSGKGRFVIEPVNLSSVVEDMRRLLGDIVRAPARLELSLVPDLPSIQADRSQLQQLIMALVRNAGEAVLDHEGTVTLTTGSEALTREQLTRTYLDEGLPSGRYVYLDIHDTGSGMDARTAARVFDPFFSTKGPGRGLGLAAVLGIVRGHHGTVQVRSRPGEGTSVRLWLPQAPEAGAPTGRRQADAEAFQTEHTVLVVDDEDLVRDIARRILERRGFKVMTAPGGVAGLEMYHQHADAIDAVLLDITMPDLSGDEVLARIRTSDPAACVVMTSGYAVHDLAERFGAHEPSGFVQKPYSPSQLVDAMKRALHGGE